MQQTSVVPYVKDEPLLPLSCLSVRPCSDPVSQESLKPMVCPSVRRPAKSLSIRYTASTLRLGVATAPTPSLQDNRKPKIFFTSLAKILGRIACVV